GCSLHPATLAPQQPGRTAGAASGGRAGMVRSFSDSARALRAAESCSAAGSAIRRLQLGSGRSARTWAAFNHDQPTVHPYAPERRGRCLRDSRFVLAYGDAIDQIDRPTTGVAIDRHGNLGLARRVIGWIVENDEIRTQLADRQDVAVDVQLHADDG